MLEAIAELFGNLLSHGTEGLRTLARDKQELLSKDLGAAPAGWTDAEVEEVEALQRIAKRLLKVDHGVLQKLLALLSPFVQGSTKVFLGFRLADVRRAIRQSAHVAPRSSRNP